MPGPADHNCISPTQTFPVCEIELRSLGENASCTARFNLSASSESRNTITTAVPMAY